MLLFREFAKSKKKKKNNNNNKKKTEKKKLFYPISFGYQYLYFLLIKIFGKSIFKTSSKIIKI